MSDTTNTAPSGADATAPAPKSDAEASLQTQVTPEAKPEPTDEQKAAEQAEKQRQEEEGKKKNRTREFIDRLRNDAGQARREADELRRELARLQGQGQSPTQHKAQHQGDEGPKLPDYGYNFEAFQAARDAWVLEQAQRQFQQQTEQRAQQAREQETWQTYESKVAEFANDHEDFYEVVGSIPPLPLELQAAIAAHPQGPAIAYHLGNTPSDLLAYANTSPQFAGLALQQLAARLSAAPPPSVPSPVVAPPAAPAPTKPISQAPPPPPTVGGRSPTETSPEKLTDDEWYRRERERQRKR
jgi:hypothetical protein